MLSTLRDYWLLMTISTFYSFYAARLLAFDDHLCILFPSTHCWFFCDYEHILYTMCSYGLLIIACIFYVFYAMLLLMLIAMT
jgi:hypothetical protein